MNNELNISEIKKNIDDEGFHTLNNFLDNSEIELLRSYVNEKLKQNNYQYFFLTSETTTNEILNNSDFFLKFENLLKKITREFNFSIRKNENLYKVLRVVTGEKSKKVSLDFHFDAHLLTLLIPIYIPERDNSDNGNLLIVKNLRKITRSIFKNILQKLFYQSNFYKKFFINKDLSKSKTLYLKPGNAYIFNGFRTLHANMNINPKDIRATILVHYYDIFKDSILVKTNRMIRIKREQKNIKSNSNKIKD